MKFEKLESKVEKAIMLLLKNDLFLLEIKAHERSVAHKLAEYLQQEFLEYHVDCEYNRCGSNIKRIKKNRVYPDIIIHKRGNDSGNNLLAIEMKTKKANKKKLDKDCEKLKNFTSLSGKFKYQFGLFLKFDCKKLVDNKWYKDGDFKQTIKVKNSVWYDENKEEKKN